MPASIGVNLRVTGHCSQGGRKYMEDLFSVAYQQTEDERDLEYAFFGIYDGHGGSEAASFAKEHLMDSIVKQRQFWSDNDEDVLKAIRNGYMLTHLNMWKELEKWPKTVTGLPSTAGTTASVAFIRRGKIYIGHVGDSAIILGYQKDGSEEWAAKPLTLDHKPESVAEIERIRRSGGKVISKAGVPRVVWNRPRVGHKGPIKKNTPMDEIPFLAVARSLGDLWSYNPANDEFVVSPDPDVGVLTIDPTKFRCLIFGTDGLWNMISPEGAVSLVQSTERHNEAALVGHTGTQPRDWLNPSKSLVDHALERWSNTRMRADNTSVVTLMLDPPGPPRATVLRSRSAARAPPATAPSAPSAAPSAPSTAPEAPPQPASGLTIMTRYSDADRPGPPEEKLPPCASLDTRFSLPPPDDASPAKDSDDDAITNYGNPAESYFMARLLNRTRVVNTLCDVYEEIVNGDKVESDSEPATSLPEGGDAAREVAEEADRESPVTVTAAGDAVAAPAEDEAEAKEDGGIQINEVSSSSPTEAPPRHHRGRKNRDGRRDGAAAPLAQHTRVLRSHHEGEPTPRGRPPATRGRGPPAAPPAPAPAPAPMERVVILSRRAPPKTQSATPEPAEVPRATRSSAACSPLAQKITRSISTVARELRAAAGGARAGNCPRAPGPAPDRRVSAARPHSKENQGARRRARSRAAPVEQSRPRPPRRADSPEVHSTTPEVAPLRALRSRNEPAGGTGAPPGKRPRTDAAPSKPAKPAWQAALPLRNRLRKRHAK